jgi:flotillin
MEQGLSGIVIFAIAGGAVVVVLLLGYLASRYQKAGPNEGLIVYGRGRSTDERRAFRIVKGGGTIVWPVLNSATRLSLEIMTLDIKTPIVYTQQGVPVVVEGVSQVKVKGDDVSISTAAEQFLGKSQAEIAAVAHQTLEGHLRALIGTMSVEEIVTNRDVFAQKVQEISTADLANMGLVSVSFTIKDIGDTQGYLEAWGKPRIAQVKRDAVIGEAEANRDATIKSAQANQAGQTAKFAADTQVAQADRDYQMAVAQYTAQVKEQQAKADLAYDLQRYKTAQEVKQEEVQVSVVDKTKQIEVQAKEIERKQKELSATIERPADAERYRIETLANAEKFRLQTTATGQADAIKLTGFAEADANKARGLAQAEVIQAQGTAEAVAMQRKAEAWRQYNEAAIAQMFIEKLPEVAKAIAEPLTKTEKIVIVSTGDGTGGAGAHKVTKDIVEIVAQLPPVLEALTGIDVNEMIQRVPALGAKKEGEAPKEEPNGQPKGDSK